MAIYKVGADGIEALLETSFQESGMLEKTHLQRLLREQIEIVSPDTLVIAEGFRGWEDSRRGIDLLAIDKDANLVVIELKRTDDAGHAELQAIRYAAMVSTMTFEKAVQVYADYLGRRGSNEDAETAIVDFLGWEDADEDHFAQDVRIVLVSADFSEELTTSVMWLNDRNVDIRCVRMKPYNDRGQLLVDVQQVIPLPEAAEYVVRIRDKAVRERQDRAGDETRQALRLAFWQALLESSRGRTDLFANVSPSQDGWIATGTGISGIHLLYVIRKQSAAVQLVLEREKDRNKTDFDALRARRQEIEQAYGGTLRWERCDELKKSYVTQDFADAGYRDNQEDWPALQDRMIDAMIRLDRTFRPYLEKLRAGEPDAR